MRLIGAALLAAAFMATCQASCEAGGETCASAKGNSMLRRWDTPQSTMAVKEEAEVGTTEYEYAGARISIPADSEVAKTGSGRWILMAESANCTDADVENLTKNMPYGSKLDYKGHPDDGGFCMIMMNGTKEDVEQELATHSFPSPPNVTADLTIEMIPEIGIQSIADNPKSWGLDRIDDATGLDDSYEPVAGYPSQGDGIHVYVLDTGIRISHRDFGGRAYSAFTMYPSMKECQQDDANCGRDGHGHGTHCAGTVGGSAYGVAKKAKIHGVKVLSDRGSGSFSGIIKGIEFVVTKGKRPAVISMSIGARGTLASMTIAVVKAVHAGVPVVVAAGNDGGSACWNTPANIQAAITVGATDKPSSASGSRDRRASYSSHGACVDIFAPGTKIVSTHHTWNGAIRTMSGTSMACPHVAGVAALMLGEAPTLTPDVIAAKMKAQGVFGNIDDVKADSPNTMLQIGSSLTEVAWETFLDPNCTIKGTQPAWGVTDKVVFRKALGSDCAEFEYFAHGQTGSGTKYLKLNDDATELFMYNGKGCTGVYYKIPHPWLKTVECPSNKCTPVAEGIYEKTSGMGFELPRDAPPFCTTDDVPRVKITSIAHPVHGAEGKYFFFDADEWTSVFKTRPSGKQEVQQWRRGAQIWEGEVKVWDNRNGVHGRRNVGAAAAQWQVGDEMHKATLIIRLLKALNASQEKDPDNQPPAEKEELAEDEEKEELAEDEEKDPDNQPPAEKEELAEEGLDVQGKGSTDEGNDNGD